MRIFSIHIQETREGWLYRPRFAYEGALPRAPQQRKVIARFLDDRAKEMREQKPKSLGRADDFQKKPLVQRSDWLIEHQSQGFKP